MSTYKITQNLKLKVYDRLFAAFKPKKKGTEDDFLAYMTPSDDSSASRKREDSARSWAKFWGNDTSGYIFREEEYLTNEPLEGFAITDSLKRIYWGGGNVVWRVRDPRGFELEIQSQCLMSILASCTLKEGVIQGKCVWARDGSNNILLPEASMEYSTLIKKEVKGKKYVSPSKLVKGARYLVGAQEDEYVYCGKYRSVAWDIEKEVSDTGHWMTGFTRTIQRPVKIHTEFGEVYTELEERKIVFKHGDESKVLYVFRYMCEEGETFQYIAYSSPKCLPTDSRVEEIETPRILNEDSFSLASGYYNSDKALVSLDVSSWKLDWAPSRLNRYSSSGVNYNVFRNYSGVNIVVSFEGDSAKYSNFLRKQTEDTNSPYIPVLSEVSFDGSSLKFYNEGFCKFWSPPANTNWCVGEGLKTKNLTELDPDRVWDNSSSTQYRTDYPDFTENMLDMEEKGLL